MESVGYVRQLRGDDWQNAPQVKVMPRSWANCFEFLLQQFGYDILVLRLESNVCNVVFRGRSFV